MPALLLAPALLSLAIHPAAAAGGDLDALQGAHIDLQLVGDRGDRLRRVPVGPNVLVLPSEGGFEAWLSQGGEFQVFDPDGRDGEVELQLPDPDPNRDGVTAWSVYVRTVGLPSGRARLTDCFFDEAGDRWCDTGNLLLTRDYGAPMYSRIDAQLSTACMDLDRDRSCDRRVRVFDEQYLDYLWSFDAFGQKIARLRLMADSAVQDLDP